MKILKLLAAMSLAAIVFTACQKEQSDINNSNNNLNATSIRIPNYGDIIAIRTDEKRYGQNGCGPAVNNSCVIFDTYPYPWLWVFGGPDFIYYYEVGPVEDGTDPTDIQLDEGSSTSVAKYTIYDSKVEIEIIKYSDDSMYDENEWIYEVPEDTYIKFGETSTVGETVANVMLKAGTYEIVPSEDEQKVGTVSVDAVVQLIE